MTEPVAASSGHPTRPAVNEVTLDHPWQWLADGWKDLRRAPKYSLTYGFVYVAVSCLLTLGLIYGDMFFIIPPLAAGFFLVAPLLGIGLYRISESLAKGEKVDFRQAWRAWKQNEVQFSAMALTLLMVVLVWMLAAILVFALFYDRPIPTWENFIPAVFLSGKSPLFLITGIVVGGLIAAFTFGISLVTVPMLMDRHVNLLTAMQTSLEATRRNWSTMLLWASLIVMFVGVGLVTFYLGLLVTMPLVGHATWHAYRDLVPGD